MLGVYDFCGHYDWTFRWLAQEGGPGMPHRYWDEAIRSDAQRHAAHRIRTRGLKGMAAYWGHTLNEEAPAGGYAGRVEADRFVLEMTDCPSLGFLLRNGIAFSGDYCDHCIGWIGPLMKAAGYAVNHAHNHEGQCYWEFVPIRDAGPVPPPVRALQERCLATWKAARLKIDRFAMAHDARAKK